MATVRPQPVATTSPVIFIPGGGRTISSPSPSSSPIVLSADAYGGWSCEANNSCNSSFSPAVIATITIMSLISFMAIFGMILWVRMRTKRDTDVGQAQKKRRDRYLNRRRSRSRRKETKENSAIASLSLSRLNPKKQGSGYSTQSENLQASNQHQQQQLIVGQIMSEPQPFTQHDHTQYNQPSTSAPPPGTFILTTQPPQNGGWFAVPAGPPVVANPQMMMSVAPQQPIQVYQTMHPQQPHLQPQQQQQYHQ